MTGSHAQHLCDSFASLASKRKGHFAQHRRLLNRPARMGWRARGKPFGKNDPWTGGILAPEAANLNEKVDLLPRTRQVGEASDIVGVDPIRSLSTERAIGLS